MISRIFKNNDQLLLFSIPLCALIISVFSLFAVQPQAEPFHNSVVLPFLLAGIQQAWILKLINFTCLLVGAFLVYYLTAYCELSDKQNFIPSFVYLLLGATLNNESVLHPLLIANILLLFMFILFSTTYRSDNALSAVFDASFLLSLASLVYFPLLFFFPLCFIGVLLYKTFNLREWILIATGLVLPYFIAFIIFWLLGYGPGFWQNKWEAAFLPFHSPVFPKGSFLINTIVILLLLMTAIYTIMHGVGGKIKEKKGKYFLLWFFVTGLPLAFIVPDSPVFLGIVLIIPCSIFIGDYLGKIKKPGIADFLLLLFITAFVFSRLQSSGFFSV